MVISMIHEGQVWVLRSAYDELGAQFKLQKEAHIETRTVLCKDIERLEAQFPAGMKHCTIVFKSCDKGHGRLTATNWIDSGCPTCQREELEAKLDAANKCAEIADARIFDLQAELSLTEHDLTEHKKEIVRLNLGYKTLPADLEAKLATAEKEIDEVQNCNEPGCNNPRLGVCIDHLEVYQADQKRISELELKAQGVCKGCPDVALKVGLEVALAARKRDYDLLWQQSRERIIALEKQHKIDDGLLVLYAAQRDEARAEVGRLTTIIDIAKEAVGNGWNPIWELEAVQPVRKLRNISVAEIVEKLAIDLDVAVEIKKHFDHWKKV